jgi:hypothetical protein
MHCSHVGENKVLNYFALALLIFVFLVLFYGVIIIHDIPYEIAKKRQHPHQDAIHVAGWVSLLTLHVIWPFLWIWSMLYKQEQGWGMNGAQPADNEVFKQIESLQLRIEKLEQDRGE